MESLEKASAMACPLNCSLDKIKDRIIANGFGISCATHFIESKHIKNLVILVVREYATRSGTKTWFLGVFSAPLSQNNVSFSARISQSWLRGQCFILNI